MNMEGEDHSILGPIINDNRILLRSFVHATTSFIRCEGNNAAHRLAWAGLQGTWELIWAKNHPDMLANVLIDESSHRNLS
ncbi:hypothetical protein TB2_021289 [Malus domestica]